MNAMQAFVPHMVEQGWARVVAVSQPAALQPTGNTSPYAIGEAGQEVLLLSLAHELHDTGVTANIVLVRAIGERESRPTVGPSYAVSLYGWSTQERSFDRLRMSRHKTACRDGRQVLTP